MNQITITQLNPITSVNVNSSTDVIPLVSISANTTNKITIDDLKTAMNIQNSDLSSVSEDILPVFDEVYDIGSTEKKFYDGYFTGKVQIGDTSITNDDGDLIFNTNTVVQGIFSSEIGDFGLLTIEDNTISINDITGYDTQEIVLENDTRIEGDIDVTGNILQNGEPFSSGVIGKGDGLSSTIRIGNNNLVQQPFGGVLSGRFNSVYSGYSNYNKNSVISGGICNQIKKGYSTIGGGCLNRLDALWSIIGGGFGNCGLGYFHNIVGGRFNNLTGTSGSFIGGGADNRSTSTLTTVVGGEHNRIYSDYGTIGGGCQNLITSSSNLSTILGGVTNTINALHSFIGGGCCNCINQRCAVIGSGLENCNAGCYSSILGGRCNSVSCCDSHILGSYITADLPCTTFVINLSIINIPTSPSGLPSGSVWRCTTDGTLRIVP